MAKNNMSVAMPQNIQDHILNCAKKIGVSKSELIRTLVVKYMGLVVNDAEETPILLMVPRHLKGDLAGLKEWLDLKVDQIEHAISPN